MLLCWLVGRVLIRKAFALPVGLCDMVSLLQGALRGPRARPRSLRRLLVCGYCTEVSRLPEKKNAPARAAPAASDKEGEGGPQQAGGLGELQKKNDILVYCEAAGTKWSVRCGVDLW